MSFGIPGFLLVSSCVLASGAHGQSTSGQPAIFLPREKILFQGDSLTDAGRNRTGGPGDELGHGYVSLIASEFGSEFPRLGLKFEDRGIAGNKIADLASRWKVDCLDLKPDVLSIFIGINDVVSQMFTAQPFSAANAYAQYDQLLSETLAAIPNLKTILCEPFILDTGMASKNYSAWSSAVEAIDQVVERLGAKYLIPVVRLQQTFDRALAKAPPNYWSRDGIHPTYAGAELIANAWVEAYKNFYTSPLLDPVRNSAICPEVNRERDSYDWLHRHDDVLDVQAERNPDVVMIGDSITNYWGGEPKAETTVNGPKAWADTFGSLRVLNMGFGWDRTQNVLWRMEHGEFEDIFPKTVVLNIGTNNLVGDDTARTNTPAEISVGIQQIVNTIHDRSPKSKIFVMAIFPRGFGNGNDLDRRITELNRLLAKELSGATLLDIGAQLRDQDGSISPKILFDGTHPTEAGYEIWGRALKKAGAIPSRQGPDR